MKTIYITFLGLLIYGLTVAQDSTQLVELAEFEVATQKVGQNAVNDSAGGASVEDQLKLSPEIQLQKRGNYAAIPVYRGLQTSQTSTLINGMQIFSACTDKMDPVSSYLAPNNFETIDFNDVGGGISTGHQLNLKLKEPSFCTCDTTVGKSQLGYNSNGSGIFANTELEFKTSTSAWLITGHYSESNNYKDGNGNEIDYSQFHKANAMVAYKKMWDNWIWSFDVIGDYAWDVGYPGLTMDVGKAQSILGSTSLKYYPTSGTFSKIENKIYYNNIYHEMDDSKRPDVAIRMDMPGWSETMGGYSNWHFNTNMHKSAMMGVTAYYNSSFAEMTMYAQDAPPMYMITWPDVGRLKSDFYGKYQVHFRQNWTLEMKASLGVQHDQIRSEMGINQMQTLGYDISSVPVQIISSGGLILEHKKKLNYWNIEANFNTRTGDITELYAFYIFNNQDNYDYIGNPDLKQEQSLNLSWTGLKRYKQWTFKANLYGYYFKNYIAADTVAGYSSMTLGADGVKQFNNIDHAFQYGGYLQTGYAFSSKLNASIMMTYQNGQDASGEVLAMQMPLCTQAQIEYQFRKVNTALEWDFVSAKNAVRASAGERVNDAYQLVNLKADAPFDLLGKQAKFAFGLYNLFNIQYTDVMSWNQVYYPGRNLQFSLTYTY